ncbi:transcriptional regulator, AraC family protein [Synechococcus sp. PCC 7335]|uniref:helix-turn-helix transcriptional regulator n=1 Tax=Synechococcus sp. (strain ATCC 29403 / PCC 7335) TaxID=91464 RepID=UPI00017EE7A9|nr:AraC family transcriptional regulator [Synechococcus sp. PCC 7335]EDX87114.1 transcriptional regulator, AraC family protein [Synechococcus sp. PCC 7335]
MTLSISVPEFLSQHPDVDIQTEAMRSPWTIPLQDQSDRSCGYRQEVNLRPGLSVLIDNYTLQDDLLVEVGSGQACEPSLSMELSFMLIGHNRSEETPAYHNFLEVDWDSTTGGKFFWQAGERVLKFDIHISAHLFETLIAPQQSSLPQPLVQLLQSTRPGSPRFYQMQPTSAATDTVIQQLLNCPYQGPTRWLFWESKVLEILVLQLEQLSHCRPSNPATFSATDIDRIYYACEILQKRLVNPPSLLELAHLVGLNDCTLKRGFRQVLDTTVFGYLTEQRMKKARRLLAQRQSVATVATAVGYASPTAFSGAFKKCVGLSPKRYQTSGCRLPINA